MDEELKQRLIYAIVAFCWVVIPFQWIFNSGAGFSWGLAFLGVFLGLVSGGIAYGVTVMMQDR